MNNTIIFILLVVIGIVVGSFLVVIINNIRGNSISKKSEKF